MRQGSRDTRALVLALMAASQLMASTAGCGRRASSSGGSAAEGGAAPPVTTAPTAPAKASAQASNDPASGGRGDASPPAAPDERRGTGISEFAPLVSLGECKAKSGDVATYLQRRGLGVAGRADGMFAAVWLVDVQREAQVAFAGFDGDARQSARARSVGVTGEEEPRILATGDAWTVIWFDGEGLVFTRPRWEPTPPPTIQHVGALGKAVSDNVAIGPTTAGSLVAAAPFGASRNQLGVFLFAPADPAEPPVKALGVTHHAKQPRKPAVAADATGYFVAWHEADGSIMASRFNAAGKEGDAHVVAPAPKPDPADAGTAAITRERLGLAPTGAGVLAVWAEGETLVARALDADARPRAAPWVIGKGRWCTLAPSGEGALVAWVGHDGKADEQLLLAGVAADGKPSARGLRISDGSNPVKDPPTLAVAGARVGVGWTEMMGPGVSTKRAVLRVLERSCIP